MEFPDRNLQSPSPPSAEPGTVFLETERLILRRHQQSDAPDMAEIANYVEIFNGLRDRYPMPYTREEADKFIKRRCDPALQTVYPVHVAILVKPTSPGEKPRLVGSAGFMQNDDVEYRTWNLGYWLTPSAWGLGYATEALSALVKWVFATWPKLNRLESDVYGNNAASMKVLTKAGFTREGVKRGAAEKNGVLVDEVIFGFVRSDLEQ